MLSVNRQIAKICLCRLEGNLQFPFFQKIVIPFMVKNDMIQKLDAESFAGIFQPAGNGNIFPVWYQTAGRMVMGNNDCRCPVAYGIGKDFVGVYLGFIDQTH